MKQDFSKYIKMIGAMLVTAGDGYVRGYRHYGNPSGLDIGGSTGNKYESHQGTQEKTRRATGFGHQYVKPVWADCNNLRFTGKGKRTESRRP